MSIFKKYEARLALKKKAHREISCISVLQNQVLEDSREKNTFLHVTFLKTWLAQGHSLYGDLNWHLKGWWYFAEMGVKIDGRIVQVLREPLKRNRHLQLLASGQILNYASNICKTAPKPFLEYVYTGELVMPVNGFIDKIHLFAMQITWVWQQIIENDLRNIAFLPESVQHNAECVKHAIQIGKSAEKPGIFYVPSCFLSDISVACWAINQDPRSFKYLSYKLRTNKELLCAALLCGDIQAINATSEALRYDDHVLHLLILLVEKQEDLPKKIQNNPFEIIKAARGVPIDVVVKISKWRMDNEIIDHMYQLSIRILWPQIGNVNFDPMILLTLLENICKYLRASNNLTGASLMQYEGNSDEKNIRDQIEQLIRCPICLERLDKDAKQCTRGHLLCSSCLTKLIAYSVELPKCPICRSKGGENGGFHTSLLASSLTSLLI